MKMISFVPAQQHMTRSASEDRSKQRIRTHSDKKQHNNVGCEPLSDDSGNSSLETFTLVSSNTRKSGGFLTDDDGGNTYWG